MRQELWISHLISGKLTLLMDDLKLERGNDGKRGGVQDAFQLQSHVQNFVNFMLASLLYWEQEYIVQMHRKQVASSWSYEYILTKAGCIESQRD